MSSNMVMNRVRLFPMLIGCAVLALTVRSVDIYTGFEILGTPVQAAQEAEPETDKEDTAATEEEKPAAEVPRQAPRIIGLQDSEERKLILQLRARRLELDRREQQLDLQTQLLSSTETRIENKIQQLAALENSIKDQLRIYDERENEKLKAIVNVYEKMKPKDAAPRFEQLTLEIQVDLVTRMKAQKVASLMEKMSPAKASALTKELATRAAPPDITELQQ